MGDNSKHTIGQAGENAALDYLIKNGFKKKETNYRYKRAEIDLIVECDDLLVFVEVKTRNNIQFGQPETFVSSRKEELFLEAAEHYINEVNWEKDIRFDIIAVNPRLKSIDHFPDAFH